MAVYDTDTSPLVRSFVIETHVSLNLWFGHQLLQSNLQHCPKKTLYTQFYRCRPTRDEMSVHCSHHFSCLCSSSFGRMNTGQAIFPGQANEIASRCKVGQVCHEAFMRCLATFSELELS